MFSAITQSIGLVISSAICRQEIRYIHLILHRDWSSQLRISLTYWRRETARAVFSQSCIPAGRISYVLGLSGPCMAIDTACSSGLVAIANAHNALMLGAIPAAIAGGVNLLLSPSTHAMYAVAGKTTIRDPTTHHVIL